MTNTTTQETTTMIRTEQFRQLPKINIGNFVTVENAYMQRLARITEVRRGGPQLNHLIVTVVPAEFPEDGFENLDLFGEGDLVSRPALVLHINDDGLPYKSSSPAALSLEHPYF